ncbi:MAG: plasmid pRiA4b ORF-3 family protein [Dokdonella sp.]
MTDTLHHLKIALKNVRPTVVREVLVPSTLRLDRLHAVIQTAMGWGDVHMHEFIVGTLRDGERFGTPTPDVFAVGSPTRNEKKFTLRQAAPAKGSKFVYWYDFGDDWYHDISVKAVVEVIPDLPVPYCLKASRACPPEDCGGPGGYANLLAILADPTHEEHADMCDWIGEPFDPEAVDVDLINEGLWTLARDWNRPPSKRKPTSR